MARKGPDDPLEPSSLHDELARERGERPRTTYVFTRDAARQLDRLAEEQYAIPGIVLMENAATATADVALRMLQESPEPAGHVLIVCGPGNNGGDGLAIARHLHNAGVDVRIALMAPVDKIVGDAGANLEIAKRMKLKISGLPAVGAGKAFEKLVGTCKPPSVLIDALLGTGLRGSIRGPAVEVIPAMNALRKVGTRVLAVDLPSGMDSDTGVSLGQTVIADVTVTMAGLKAGFEALEAQNYLGETVIADIGLPKELLAKLGKVIRPRGHPGEDAPRDPAPRKRTPGR